MVTLAQELTWYVRNDDKETCHISKVKERKPESNGHGRGGWMVKTKARGVEATWY